MKFLVLVGVLLLVGVAAAANDTTHSLPGTVVVARGEQFFLDMGENGGTCWYFPDADVVQPKDLLDIHATGDWCILQPSQTANMPSGKYTLIYESPTFIMGKPILSVFYSNTSLSSILSSIQPVSFQGMKSRRSLSEVKQMINSAGMNRYETVTIDVRDPSLKITDIYPMSNNIYRVAGTSNLNTGTEIKIVVDEMEHYDRDFKFKTYLNRTSAIQLEGTWSYNMNLPIDDMAPGWHSVTVYAKGLQTSVRFPLYTGMGTDNTTVEKPIHYLGDGNIAPKIITVEKPVIQKEYVVVTVTPPPTPIPTDAVGYPVPVKSSSGSFLNLMAGLLVILGIVVVGGRQ